MKKIYPFGYSDAAIQILETRKLDFELLYQFVDKNSLVLDIGCGPGRTTIDLSKHVINGKVVGVDIEPTQIELAKRRGSECKASNCEFYVADIYSLPFGDESFDAIYSNNVAMNVSNHNALLKELSRVLKKGGVVVFCELDFSLNVFVPDNSAIAQFYEIMARSGSHNDRHYDIGSKLPKLLKGLGFNLEAVNPELYMGGTLSAKVKAYDNYIALWNESEFPKQAVELGWIPESELKDLPERLRLEKADMTVIHGLAVIETVARKPE